MHSTAMTPERGPAKAEHRARAARAFVARALGALALAAATAPAFAAWEPTAAVELVVPAGPGGGADQMVRFI